MQKRLPVTSVPAEREQPRAVDRRRWRHWKPIWRQRLITLTLLSSDVLLALLVSSLAYLLHGIWGRGELYDIAVASVTTSVAVWVGLRGLLGLYPGYGLDSAEGLRRHVYSVFANLAVLTVFAVGFQVADLLSRLLLALTFLGLLFLTPLAQYFVKVCMKRAGLWGKPVIILSYKDTGAQLTKLLEQEWGIGYVPVALFEYNLTPAREAYQEAPYVGTLADAVHLSRERGVDTVIFAMPYTRREHLAMLVTRASASFRQVVIIPNLAGITNSAVTARNLAGIFAVEIKHNLLNPWALRIKRVFDLVVTVAAGALVSPLILVLALLVYLESRGGPVFYKDRRMGQDSRLFSCVKFRTMMPDAEELLQRILEEDAELREEYTKYHKLRNDPRVTRIGRFLRKTSLDELPQIWNVLRGEMSLVGPRPYLPRESEEIGPAQNEILRVPPGISGQWQVSGRNHTSFGERVEMDAYYVRDWSIWLDIVLLARTVKIVLFGRGAY
jgi:Undecaprenyl-phosphate galactose phosphotransferase WbaP